MRTSPTRKAVAVAACAALLLSGGTAAAAATGMGGTGPAGTGEAGANDGARAGGRAPARGTLVTAEPLYTLHTAQDAAAELDRLGFDGAGAAYGVDAYQLVYHTVDEGGRPTVASGLLTLPRGAERALHAVSFTHGTGVHRSDAPSMTRDFVSAPAVSYAAAGFAGVAPDYLGLGLGPGPHPWMDVPSETSAALDLLRAARAFAPEAGHTLRPDVFVTGFSQGASAALGLGRELQEGGDRHFRVAALAPVSGAYDLGGTELPALLDGRLDPKMSTVYTAYLAVAFERLHGGLYDDPAEIFRERYAGTVEELFSGAATGPEVMAGTPGTVEELFTEEGLRRLGAPGGAFAAALDEAGEMCTDWAPRVPTRLYVTSGDTEALPGNTDWCRDGLRAAGARPEVVDLGAVSYEGSPHLGSAVAATAATVEWFGGLVE